MKIQQAQSKQTFQSKQRFLSKSQLLDAQALLTKMNKETKTVKNEYTFSSDILSGLKIKDQNFGNNFFYDQRGLTGETDKFYGESKLQIGKTKLTFDNNTGEITNYKKPLFKSWDSFMENISSCLKTALVNFDNHNIVEKITTRIEGFTNKGSKRIMDILKNG